MTYTPWPQDVQEHYERLEAELGRLHVMAATMATALEGVVNSACHPDIARCSVMVPLDPVRAALKTYRQFYP